MSTSLPTQLAGDDNPSSLSLMYSCATCLVSFESSVVYRAHMRCDWHLYNLKRRISSLPAVSLNIFEEQVVPLSITSHERDDSSTRENCDVCRKVFSSRQAYQGHLRTHHRARNLAGDAAATSQIETLAAEMNATPVDKPDDLSTGKSRGAAENQFVSSACIFCTIASSDMENNLTHMQRIHGLFIPDQEHLIDLESFLNYLFTVIYEFQECLYCSITKSTVEGIQHHMKDKGHCNINFEQGSEWQLFYEYSDSESDAEPPKSRPMTSPDDELHLPSRKILGHRSQVRHHQPNPPTRAFSSALTAPSHPETVASLSTTATTRSHNAQTNQQLTVRTTDRLGMIGVPAQQQRALRAVEKMMLKRESRARDAYQAGVQKAGNRQKLFKPDVPGRSNG